LPPKLAKFAELPFVLSYLARRGQFDYGDGDPVELVALKEERSSERGGICGQLHRLSGQHARGDRGREQGGTGRGEGGRREGGRIEGGQSEWVLEKFAMLSCFPRLGRRFSFFGGGGV